MNPPQLDIVTLAVGAAIIIVLSYRLWLWPPPGRPRPATGIVEPSTDLADSSDSVILLHRTLSHQEPSKILTIEESHQTMQLHIGCHPDSCASKRSALRVLIESGRIVPDPRAERRLNSE